MTISYNWLSEYLPWSIEPEKLSKILTSIGLEVESLTEEGETGNSTKRYVTLLNNWSNISGETASL